MGLTKAQLEALNITSFPDNTTGLITPAILRGYNTASIENTVNQDVYTTDSASVKTSINALNAATSSYATSAITASSLITASFDNGTRNLTFTKGNNTQFSVNIPDVSGSSGNFATTGSNSFIGNQTITGSLLLNGTEVNMTSSVMRFTTTGTGSITFVPGGSVRFQGNTDFTNPVRVPIINVDNLAGGGYYGFNAEVDGRIYQDFSGSVNTRINNIVAGTGFATTGSNSFNGNQTITGSVIISGSAGIDLRVIGTIYSTGSEALIQNTNGVNGQYMGVGFGGNVGVYNVSNLTELGLALDGNDWTTNWANGPIIYVNNTPGDTYEGVFGFQNKANYTDGRITALKRLDVSGSVSVSGSSTFRGNQTITGSLILSSSANVELEVIGNAVITGSLTISSSAANDLTIFGRQLITGPITGQTPQLLISGSDFTNRIDRGFIAIVGSGSFVPTLTISGSSHRNIVAQRAIEIAKPGFDYPVFNYAYSAASSSVLFNFTENLSQTASYTLGVFDNGFTQDVELSLETDVTNGIQLKDIRSDTGAYTTFLKIAPNGGTNPPLEFKRGMQVTGSLSVTGSGTINGSAIVTANQTGSFIRNFGAGSNPLEFTYDLGNGGSNSGFFSPPTSLTGSVRIASNSQLTLPTGSNQQAGTAVLNGGNPGTVTVSNSLVTANSIIMVSKQTLAQTNGYVAVSSKGAGTFTITSNHNGDDDTVGWFIINNS